MRIKAVVARYNEPIDWIENIGLDYIIYNKGNSIDSNLIDQDKVVHVPNEGREGETYLRYITENYYEIPDLVVFLQGNPFDHFPKLFDVLSGDMNTSGMISLGSNTFCDTRGNESYPGLPVGEFRHLITPTNSEGERIDFVAGAQFIVPGDMIRNKPIEWWNELKELYNRYWFSDIPSGYGIPNGHFIGHVFERLWPSIFKYKLPPNG